MEDGDWESGSASEEEQKTSLPPGQCCLGEGCDDPECPAINGIFNEMGIEDEVPKAVPIKQAQPVEEDDGFTVVSKKDRRRGGQ